MKHVFRSGIWLLAATVVAFGGFYPVEMDSVRKPLAGPIMLSDVKAGTSVGSPITHGTRQYDLAHLAPDVAPSGTERGIRIADPWEMKKYKGPGLEPRLISLSPPVPGASSKVSFARAQCNDWEKHLKSLDEPALRPSSGFDRDHLDRERKKAREMMSGLDCVHA